MKTCNQTSGQTILQHGLSVWRFIDLLLNKDYSEFKMPEWWEDYSDEIYKNLYSRKTIKHYAIWHDCGKPFCLETSADGKQHFPNHAEISYNKFIECFGTRYMYSGILIKHDMLLHTATIDEIERLEGIQKETIATLLLAAIAALHANKEAFATGFDSTNFKIKWKRLNSLGKKICKERFS